MSRPPLLERAYELARSGGCATLKDIKARLKAEDYEHVNSHLDGIRIRNTLRDLCRSHYVAPGND